jgi:uncharacterized CHY-type Zn-finger protein
MKINKIQPVQNSLYNKHKNSPYDIVRIYCKSCNSKMDIHVYHSFGKLEYYQLNNLPEKISKHLDTRKVVCNNCDKSYVLEKQPTKTTSDYILKLDCSNMHVGMESWYEDAIPKYSKETYA